MVILIVVEWEVLYNCYYWKLEVYIMCWNGIDLSWYKVVCVRFGGLIVMVWDEFKMV